MKYVDIYVYGNSIGGSGMWLTLLKYGKRERLLKGFEKQNSTVNRLTLVAIIEGLRALKEPCNVTVYTAIDYIPKTFELGWKRKSNLDLWALIDDKSRPHTVRYSYYSGIKAVFSGKE